MTTMTEFKFGNEGPDTTLEANKFAKLHVTPLIVAEHGQFSEEIYKKAWAKWVRFSKNYNSPASMANEYGATQFVHRVRDYYNETLKQADGKGTANRELATEIRHMHMKRRK